MPSQGRTEDKTMKEAKVKKALGKEDGGKKKGEGKRHVREMHLRRAANGGYIARHDMEPGEDGEMPQSEDHILPDMAAVHDHMDEHMGDGQDAGEDAEADAGPTGQPGAPPPTAQA